MLAVQRVKHKDVRLECTFICVQAVQRAKHKDVSVCVGTYSLAYRRNNAPSTRVLVCNTSTCVEAVQRTKHKDVSVYIRLRTGGPVQRAKHNNEGC